MNLYDPNSAGSFVFAVLPKGTKSNNPTFMTVGGQDLGSAQLSLTQQGYTLAGPGVMGKYDDRGIYCTYCPAVPGAEGSRGLGRFVPHPDARADRTSYDAQVINNRYAGKHAIPDSSFGRSSATPACTEEAWPSNV